MGIYWHMNRELKLSTLLQTFLPQVLTWLNAALSLPTTIHVLLIIHEDPPLQAVAEDVLLISQPLTPKIDMCVRFVVSLVI